jgi:predicted DNA-binding transcriptional regulator AlpA
MATFVSPGEIADMLGVSRQRVDQLTRQPGFPKPVYEGQGGRIWRTKAVERWQANRQTIIRGET